MTGRTHDLAAFTALNLVLISQPLQQMSLATALVAFSANMVGGLAPDLDQPTAKLWRDLPAGTIFGKILSPILGGHRFISHSFLGIFLFGFGFKLLLGWAGKFLLVNLDLVWWAFMIGFISHLLMDTLTREGVPWLFPIPFNFGLPPFKFLRMKTGGFLEKTVIFPGLILANGFVIYNNYGKLLDFIRHFINY